MKIIVMCGVVLQCAVCQEWLVIRAASFCFSVYSEFFFLVGSQNKIYSGRFRSSGM